MIAVSTIFECFKKFEVNFFTGVPDSLLKYFCAYLSDNLRDKEHIIAANEGAAVALATGYHLATGKIPLVYLQNSGLGNAINPLISLADKEVYGIPLILMIGWRGEPGVKDEPQHIKQGRVQNALLDAMEIPYRILDATVSDIESFIESIVNLVKAKGAPVAIVVRSNTFDSYKRIKKEESNYEMKREEAIATILDCLNGNEIIVSTTGYTSRELFELRVARGQGNRNDFLTVGSMGHTSQIALGIAINSARKVLCLDGDGSLIMHMGSLAVTGNSKVENLIHVVLNNGAHDSVGGQPTVGFQINLKEIAHACGFAHTFSLSEKSELATTFKSILSLKGPVFLEIRTKKGARADLGRPTKSPGENKSNLMNTLGIR